MTKAMCPACKGSGWHRESRRARCLKCGGSGVRPRDIAWALLIEEAATIREPADDLRSRFAQIRRDIAADAEITDAEADALLARTTQAMTVSILACR